MTFQTLRYYMSSVHLPGSLLSVDSRQKLDSEIFQNPDISSKLPRDFSFAHEYKNFMSRLVGNFSSLIPEQAALLSERIATDLEVMYQVWGINPDYIQLWRKFEGLKSFGPMHSDNWTVNIDWEWSSVDSVPTEIEFSSTSMPPGVRITTSYVSASTTRPHTAKSVSRTKPFGPPASLKPTAPSERELSIWLTSLAEIFMTIAGYFSTLKAASEYLSLW